MSDEFLALWKFVRLEDSEWYIRTLADRWRLRWHEELGMSLCCGPYDIALAVKSEEEAMVAFDILGVKP